MRTAYRVTTTALTGTDTEDEWFEFENAENVYNKAVKGSTILIKKISLKEVINYEDYRTTTLIKEFTPKK